MKKHVVYVPTSRGTPDGPGTREVAEDLGIDPFRLLDATACGSIPCPVPFGKRLVWGRSAALDWRVNGLRIPGTFPALPAVYVMLERRRLARAVDAPTAPATKRPRKGRRNRGGKGGAA